MSVALTEDQVRNQSKDVTRRLGWKFIREGEVITLCRKVMGRRAGEPLVRICDVRIVSVRRERLSDITDADAAREGFPHFTGEDFVEFFTRSMRCHRDTLVTRIEWRYLPPESWIDKHGDVWTLGPDGLMRTPETAPFPREHVERKWGPLRSVTSSTQPARMAPRHEVTEESK